jgi:D-alanyl-D-alanine endopeptidase (penicillin-binding protein 7)
VNAFSFVLVQAVGWVLLHFVWKGALIGSATALSMRLLRDASPQRRYALLCLSLLLCFGVPLLDAYQYVAVAVAAPDTTVAPAVITVLAQRQGMPAVVQQVMPWLVAAWLLGVSVMTCRLAAGLAWVHRIRNVGRGWADAKCQAYVSGLAAHCGISRKITLRVADDLSGPLTVGWWRPLVLVPAALLTQMPPDLLEALLAHEVAHIKRIDYLVNLLQGVIEALLFYHPVVWWLSRRIRGERELVADNLAAMLIQEPRRLALALERLSILQAAGAPDASIAQWARGGRLLERIKRLSQSDVRPSNRKMLIPAIALCLTVFCVVPHVLRLVPATHDGTAQADIAPAPVSIADSVTQQSLQALLGTIESNHVVVVDDNSGKVLLRKSADDVVPIASLTKLMTAMVVLDTRPDMDRTIHIDQADTEALLHSRTTLPVGASLPLREVLQLALMSSNNSAAYALAHNYPGGLPAFRVAMLAKIVALGLKHTTIDEPTGLSPLNTSTASDVALMADAAARYPAIARYTTYSSDIVRINGKPVEYRNTNPFVGQKGWDIALSKTGFTNEAGRCLIMRLRSFEKNVTMVLLDADQAASAAHDAVTIRRMLLSGKPA